MITNERDDFLRLARAKSIMPDDRLRRCMAEWEGRGGAASGLHAWDVALELKFITQKVHSRVVEHMGFITMRESDKLRGAGAVRAGLVKQSDLEVALFLQRKSYKDRREVKRIEEYLMGLNALRADQIQEFKEAAEKFPPQAAGMETLGPSIAAEPPLDDELTLDNPELLKKYLAEESAPRSPTPGDDELTVLEPISGPDDGKPKTLVSEFDDEEGFQPPPGEGNKK